MNPNITALLVAAAFAVIGGVHDLMIRFQTKKMLGKERYKAFTAWRLQQSNEWVSPIIKAALAPVLWPIAGVMALLAPHFSAYAWWVAIKAWPDLCEEELELVRSRVPKKYRKNFDKV